MDSYRPKLPKRESLGPSDAMNNRYVCAASRRSSRKLLQISIASACTELAVLQCRTCIRPGAHGFSASKGFLGFDEELRVLELDGLVFDFEKILVLLYYEP